MTRCAKTMLCCFILICAAPCCAILYDRQPAKKACTSWCCVLFACLSRLQALSMLQSRAYLELNTHCCSDVSLTQLCFVQFFASYTNLLKSSNYVTRRQSLKVRLIHTTRASVHPNLRPQVLLPASTHFCILPVLLPQPALACTASAAASTQHLHP